MDFDLAFTADRFVSPYTGTNDQSLFQSWLDSGLTEMERALGGEAVNTGVLTSAKVKRVVYGGSFLTLSLQCTFLAVLRFSNTQTEIAAICKDSSLTLKISSLQ